MTAAGHPLLSKVSIQFDWGDTLSDWSEFMAANDFYHARHAFAHVGEMLVRARARDALDHISAWSKPESVFVKANDEDRSPNDALSDRGRGGQ